MRQIFDNYYFIPATIALVVFSISLLSIPIYFRQCEKLVALIDQIKEYGKIVKSNLSFDYSYMFRWKWAFRKLPNEINHPELYRFKPILEQIQVIKIIRRFYLIVVFIFLVLIPVLYIAANFS
jgi:hypothetical protein